MEDRKIYEDIALRTEGDIYVGVVGPVRTGKSTFINSILGIVEARYDQVSMLGYDLKTQESL